MGKRMITASEWTVFEGYNQMWEGELIEATTRPGNEQFIDLSEEPIDFLDTN